MGHRMTGISIHRNLIKVRPKSSDVGLLRIPGSKILLLRQAGAPLVRVLNCIPGKHRRSSCLSQRWLSTKAMAQDEDNMLILTEAAAERMREIGRLERPDKYLRLYVDAGGCHGFKYVFELVSSPDSDDMYVLRYPII